MSVAQLQSDLPKEREVYMTVIKATIILHQSFLNFYKAV